MDHGWRAGALRVGAASPAGGRGRECGYDAELDLPTLVGREGGRFRLGGWRAD
jgi:hypothetical protein